MKIAVDSQGRIAAEGSPEECAQFFVKLMHEQRKMGPPPK